MRAVVQRVSRAEVTVGGTRVAEIGTGLLVLLGVAETDGPEDATRLAGKIARLRIFAADDGRFDRSLLDAGGAALVVSQFTLIADSKRQKGTRPDFHLAARPEVAELCTSPSAMRWATSACQCERGAFGALMTVELVNDGPVTIVLDAASSLIGPLGLSERIWRTRSSDRPGGAALTVNRGFASFAAPTTGGLMAATHDDAMSWSTLQVGFDRRDRRSSSRDPVRRL